MLLLSIACKNEYATYSGYAILAGNFIQPFLTVADSSNCDERPAPPATYCCRRLIFSGSHGTFPSCPEF